jgi:MipA family protein
MIAVETLCKCQMRTSTFSFLLMIAIAEALVPGARAADGGAQATGNAPAADATSDSSADGDSCTGPSRDCVAVGHWNFNISLGAGVRTDPLDHEAAIPLVVIPQFSYYGKRVFIEDLDLGFMLTESDSSTLSLIATPGYDRVFFDRGDLQNLFVSATPYEIAAVREVNGVPVKPRPRWTYLAGPEWTFETHGISGQLDVLHEITAQNHGNEVRAALGFPLIESTGSLSANVGLTWKSSAIVRYYYGVPGIYEGGCALDPFVKLGYSRPLSSKWRLTAFVNYEYLGSAIADSPIVNANYVITAFVGANYTF